MFSVLNTVTFFHLDRHKNKRETMNREQVLQELKAIIEEYWSKENQSNVVNYVPAFELEKKENWSLNAPHHEQEILKDIEKYLHYAVRTEHPYFMNQLFGGFDLASWVGETIAALTNTSMATYEIAPLGSILEKTLIKKLNTMIGFRTLDNPGEGIMLTGGSNANLVAMLCARQKKFPKMKKEGLAGKKLSLFVSQDSHYSFSKNALVMGLGTNSVIKVAVDKKGQMLPEALEKEIRHSQERGEEPFFVCATAGTTVWGAFDPIKELLPIAKNHQLWFHIDGAWGGAAILSERFSFLLEGCEEADSFAWDIHKLMSASLISSFFLCRHSGILRETNSLTEGSYIFHEYENTSYDMGPYSLQCGRKVDSLGAWLAWRHHGDEGYQKMIDHLGELASYLVEKINRTPQLELIREPPFLNVCFRILDSLGKHNQLNLKVRQKLIETGTAMINYYSDKGVVFFRLILTNPQVKKCDLDQLLTKIIDMAE